MTHHDHQRGTPHMDSRRQAEESIARTGWYAFRPDLTGRAEFTYEGGRLTAITPVDPTTDATAPTPTATVVEDTLPTAPAGPVVPAVGIGQGVRQDPPPAPLTPAQQMTAKSVQLRDRLDRMTGGNGLIL